MSDAKVAEQLWVRAHERIKAGDLAQAVRDLAKAYELLKSLRDPRIGQVHKRWVEVHKLYADRKAKAKADPEAAARAQAQAQAQARAKADAEARAQAEAAAKAQADAQAQAQAAALAAAEAQQRLADEERARREAAPMSLEQQGETAANEGRLDDAIELYRRVVAAQPENELAGERIRELEAAVGRARQLSTPPSTSTAVPEGAPLAPGQTPAEQVAFLEGLAQQIQERRRV